MGGDLTATSEGLGRGTVMTFSIPLCVPAPDDAAAAAEGEAASSGEITPQRAEAHGAASAPPSPPSQLQMSSPPPSPSSSLSPPPSPSPPGAAPGAANVLVADDDALSQAVMRKLLKALRLRFAVVSNGAEAVEAFKQGTLCASF